MLSTLTTSSLNLITTNGEPAVPLEAMPESWQRVVSGTWMTEPCVYTAMARVFLAKNHSIPTEARQKTLRAFLWSVMEEYMLFELRSATRLVYADNLTL